MGRKSVIKKRYVDLKLKEKYTIKLLVYFQKHGLNDFSMSKLASDFNISKTTLYNHFDSKESMIDAAVVYKLNSINDYKTVLFDKDLDYFERLRKAMLFYCAQIFEISRNLLKEVKKEYTHNLEAERICSTVHSSELNAIFFETIEHIRCHRFLVPLHL